MEPSGRLWPNGEFSIGYAVAPGMEKEAEFDDYIEGTLSHLGLSVDSNSHKPKDDGKPRRGTKGLTSHGKKVLRNSVGRLQRLYGKRSLSFVTLTLPDLSYSEHWYVSSNWSNIVRVFFQKLGRRLSSKGLPIHYASCTEMQPGRAKGEEVPALHLHFICVGRNRGRGAWALRPADFREIWASVLHLYVNREFEQRALENVQMVKFDASAYLSKYISKGESMGIPPRSDETGWGLPTAWYNVSALLRQWVLDHVRRCPKLMDAMERACRDGSIAEHCHYFYAGCIDAMNGPGPHYFVGKLKGESMRELLDAIREMSG